MGSLHNGFVRGGGAREEKGGAGREREEKGGEGRAEDSTHRRSLQLSRLERCPDEGTENCREGQGPAEVVVRHMRIPPNEVDLGGISGCRVRLSTASCVVAP